MQRSSIRVLVVDDSAVVRVGMKAMLRAPGIRVIGEATTTQGASRLLEARRPDVVLVDAALGEADGLAFLRGVKERWPTTSVIMLAKTGGSPHVSRAIALGCSGYLDLTMERQDILRAVRAVARGECTVAPKLLRQALKELGREPAARAQEPPQPLSAIEREVLRLIAEGLTNRQIAERLGYRIGTVKDYVQRVIQKLEVSDRTQAAVRAMRLGLVA